MTWTTPADLRARVERWWDRGALLAVLAGAATPFPLRIPLKGPATGELAERFGQARDWIARLTEHADHYRIAWRTVNHRTLGTNSLPSAVWIDSLEQALAFIGKAREAQRFAAMVAETREQLPEALAFLEKRPLVALAAADAWPRLLTVTAWLQRHPRPGIYLRQVDVAGVHSKFIEGHRAVLADLFDLALPAGAIDTTAAGAAGFCRRYGFRDKPARVRYRLLDRQRAQFPTGTDQDITLTHDTFARLDPPVETVFVTENEVNFLCFPETPGAMVVFGAGYGFDMLARADWLSRRRVYYWGDIDTHGFAILDQLRSHFPQALSFLMDRPTLMAHRSLWGEEPIPETRDLHRLSAEESALYDDLRRDRLGPRVRLEQERIGFARIRQALAGGGGDW